MLILTAVAALGSLLGVLFLILKKPGQQAPSELNEILQNSIQNEFIINREEFSKSLKDNRQELTQGLERLTEKMELKLVSLNETLNTTAKENRGELKVNLKEFPTFCDYCTRIYEKNERNATKWWKWNVW